MNNTKRLFSVAAALGLFLLNALSLTACGSGETQEVLRIYNWEDYISTEDDEEGGTVDLIAAFEEAYDCKVEYSTFGTNENMYNELQINPGSYDLVCPSDYMIMKMIKEDMLEPFSEDFKQNSAYAENVSPYIRNIFESNYALVEENGKQVRHYWSDYSIGYMWGTMGFMYNPEAVSEEAVSSWLALDRYTDPEDGVLNRATLKDSVRDTYFYALACVYNEELKELAAKHDEGGLTDEEYTAAVAKIMNRTDEESGEKARLYLRNVKKNIYGFEVDGGKNDMVTGKINVNFCWSGDAAFAIWEVSEEAGKSLYYSVPDYVSNVWFDGWVIPKGGNVSLAEKFLDFISTPENAISNMNYIGYTSVIAGDQVYEDFILDSFAVDEADFEEDTEYEEYNVGYFFTDDPAEWKNYTFTAETDDIKGMLGAQYPTKEVVTRCAVMQYFDEQANNRINQMWEDVKGAEVPPGSLLFIGVVVLVLSGIYLLSRYGNDWFHRKPKKGYVKIEK